MFQEHRDFIEELIHEHATTLVAVNPCEDDHILGWACAEPALHVLHFAWTRHFPTHMFRRQGIATALVRELGELRFYTHHTPAVERCKLREAWHLRYNPMLLHRRTCRSCPKS